MMTSLNSTIPAKKDLHVGGLGSEPAASIVTMGEAVADPLTEASETLMRKANELLGTANGYVRENPWTAIGVVGLVGLAAGFLLSRRDW
jgi:ElaB/YqjD/DUF883 family membrane-anchored ribosome-binding protein